MIRADVVRRFVLDGTIDGHDPIGVVLRVTGGLRPFKLVPISANLGRGYSPEKFKRNVWRILNEIDELQSRNERTHVVLLLQEIDEADPAEEHELLLRWLEPGTTLVGWETREPIAVSPGVPVDRKRTTLLMAQGTDIGAPVGTGPARQLVSCRATIEGVRIGFGCQHPHRNLPDERVQAARRRGRRVTRDVVSDLVDCCDLVVHGGDLNAKRYPSSHPHERVIHHHENDWLFLIDPPRR